MRLRRPIALPLLIVGSLATLGGTACRGSDPKAKGDPAGPPSPGPLASPVTSPAGSASGSASASASGSATGSAATDDLSAQVRRSEKEASDRDAARTCSNAVTVFEGSIDVKASGYTHSVERGSDFVNEPIPDVDRVISKDRKLRFTLQYPFERPFQGTVTGDLTLRRTIDAIRAGFREMYSGATERDVPGMYNKDVNGRYGRSFHAIDDLVIEGVELCGDDTLQITIGS